MDAEELTLEEKCENLMNVVVESRKRFGKMCADYEGKSTLMLDNMLKLQLETISNCKFKSKNPKPNIDANKMMKEVDDFASDIIAKRRREENLLKNVKNLQRIVLQLKEEKIGKKLREPSSVEEMLAIAKSQKPN